MGKADDERLQRYFDGELTSAEGAAFEAARTEEDELKLQALGEMRDLLRNALSAEADGVELWSGIEAKLPPWRRRRWGLSAHPAGWSTGLLALTAAALLLVFAPWHPAHAQNGCEIESLDTYGAVATVIRMDDAPHRGDEATTVIFTTEDD